MADEIKQRAAPSPPGDTAAEETVTVVAVEDEPIILRYIASRVEAMAPNVLLAGTAPNAAGALSLLEEHRPDILVTDIEMPGMSGLDLIARARAAWPDMHFVVISGYDNFAYAQQALRHGVSDYLLKPLEDGELRRTVFDIRKQILAERRAAALAAAHLGKGAEPGALPSSFAPRAGSDLASQIEQYISAYFDRPLTIAQLAQKFNYTASHINRTFKKQYTISPIQYQIQLRIARAKELLLDFPNADIKDVATAIGYDDARYFSRMFHQATGKTPSEFAQGHHR